MNSLKLLVFAAAVSLIAQSCSGPTYAQNSPPPPPAYTQPPPPPPQQQYSDQQQQPQVQVQVQASAPDQAYNQPYQDAAPPPITYQTYYNELSPYGQWVYTGEYGNVWVPYAGPGFQPYGTAGHWVLTEYGWTWVSDYPWGWAPFHYGTWDFDAFMGWFWIPGYQWAPAWVSWRSCNGYYGWAPLGPTYVSGGYATYSCPPERYVFVNATYMSSPNVATYYVPSSQNNSYYSRSNVITNTYSDRNTNNTYYAGPPQREVEGYTGAPIHQVSFVSSSSPEKTGATGTEVRMFRPTVQQPNPNDPMKPAPAKVYQKNEIAPVAQRPVLTQPNQPRVTPYKPENIQRPANEQPKQQPEAPRPQQQQPQRPPVQQPVPQQQPKQEPQQPTQQQQRPQVQQQPAQQPQRQQPQQQPARQQKQQQPKQQRPPKQPKPQKQQPQGGPQKENKQ